MATRPTERTLAARAAAYTRWSQTVDRTAATEPMRKGFLAKYEAQVDPDGVLAPKERTRRAEMARKAFMADIARRSVASRRKAKEAKAAPTPAAAA